MVFELLTERTGGAICQTESYIGNREVSLQKMGTRLFHFLPDDVLVWRLPHEHLKNPDKMVIRVAGNVGEAVEGDPGI